MKIIALCSAAISANRPATYSCFNFHPTMSGGHDYLHLRQPGLHGPCRSWDSCWACQMGNWDCDYLWCHGALIMWIETRLSRIVLNMRMPNKESILRYYSKSFKISMLPIVILCPLYRAYIYIYHLVPWINAKLPLQAFEWLRGIGCWAHRTVLGGTWYIYFGDLRTFMLTERSGL